MKIRLTLFLLLCCGVGSYGLYNYMTGWEWQFRHSPTLVFYSLRPGMPPTDSGLVYERNFSGVVLDEVVVSDSAGKEQLIAATKRALTPAPNRGMASCFNPRQAISTPDRKTIVLLCFECEAVSVRTTRGVRSQPINRAAQPLFNSLMHKYSLKADVSPTN